MANKERIAELVAALRSGQYHQGHTRLKYSDSDGVIRHCCLGVAEEVAKVSQQTASPLGQGWNFGPTAERCALTAAAVEWYDFGPESFPDHESGNPILADAQDDQPTLTMIAANDGRGWTFDQIADALEARYLA